MHILVFEPRAEGHHPTWLRFLLRDLLAAGCRITAAVDTRRESATTLGLDASDQWSQVEVRAARTEGDQLDGAHALRRLEALQQKIAADLVFLPCLDEIASVLLRRAAIGLPVPAALRGRLAGIYHRPRFVIESRLSPNRWLKQRGLGRLIRRGDLARVLFLDDYVRRQFLADLPGAPLFFLPDPCPDNLTGDPAAARTQLDLPSDQKIVLFYGGGYRRKGLHLAAAAFLADPPARAFLLCAGKQPADRSLRLQMDRLVALGHAKVIDRYVSSEEERLCFAAADIVLLPYVGHFGISAVLSQAAAAGKPVVASDEQLLGRLTRDCGLGECFRSGNVTDLGRALRRACGWDQRALAVFHERARAYAQARTPLAVRAALWHGLGLKVAEATV
jgi:glycosyltransferase involved in cell wall biosynthesis